MYKFAVFKPDGREYWTILDDRQIKDLTKPPSFLTVLSLDQDPEALIEKDEDPIDHVSYLGPMYWDFDGADLNKVLDDVREVLTHLTDNWGIPKEYIHCWLSGSKGVHITIPEQVFGVTRATKYLPLIWKEVMLSKQNDSVDTSVYSLGRGRMWRCEGIKRPKTGTYKVGVSFDELVNMNEEDYLLLVKSPRPPLKREVPTKEETYPKATAAAAAAKKVASKKVRALKNVEVVPSEVLKAIEGVPGCIEKLILEGDCAQSNWNQAAMQLACYIAGKYSRDDEDEYTELLIEPFINNIESASRPKENDRRKHLKEQIIRAYKGRIKFGMGPLIAALGEPCGHCPLCRKDIAQVGDEDLGNNYCDTTKIRATDKGYFLVGENSMKMLTTFTFKPKEEIKELRVTESGMDESLRVSMSGWLTDDTGKRMEIEIPDKSWSSRKDLLNLVIGHGTSSIHCSDAEIQKIFRAVLTMGSGMQSRTKTKTCGIILERTSTNLIPHYVEASGSYTHAGHSRFFYGGEPSASPNLMDMYYPSQSDPDLDGVMKNLLTCHTPEVLGPLIGWTVACHFKEHIHHETRQFPLLNLYGGAGSGKSSLSVLALLLGGIDYSRANFVNAEITTFYPLLRSLTSSTTVPRLVEEVNPSRIKDSLYTAMIGLFKSAWNKSPVSRGYIAAGKREVELSESEVSSPIMFLSERPPELPSLRSRCIEVLTSTKELSDNPEFEQRYKIAYRNRYELYRMAKSLMSLALVTPPAEVSEAIDRYVSELPSQLGPRPVFSFAVALFGLEMLEKTCKGYSMSCHAQVKDLRITYLEYIQSKFEKVAELKRISEVDKILSSMDVLASEDSEDRRLEPGKHYWREGSKLILDLRMSVPRYLRYARSIGERSSIMDHRGLRQLLEAESYYLHEESHPENPEVKLIAIDLQKLKEKGTALTNFQEELLND